MAAASTAAAAGAKPSVVFVLGAPGSGKGTQCDRIVKEFGYVHLSAGDLLRAERKTGSDVAELINAKITEGQIVPVDITVGLIAKAMELASTDKFLIDGFPRNADNLEGWERVMGDSADVKQVLFLDCPEETCVARVLERGKSSLRTDDNEEVLKKRFTTYQTQTQPIIDIYDKRGLVTKVQADNDVDTVFQSVAALFKSL